MDVPGSLGYSVLGDESLEFVRSPRDYIKKRQESHGAVFQTRLLNKHHIILTSSAAVHELLTEKSSNFTMGYKEFMLELFGENIIFVDGDSWSNLRRSMEAMFSQDSIGQCMDLIRRIISEYLSKIKTGKSVVVYKLFKEMVTRITIALFLDKDISDQDAREISELLTVHWRGIISVPLPIRVPWLSWKSGYSKALTAKDRLLVIIREKLNSNPSSIASGVLESVADTELVARNLLLFVSALIPKAMASLLTSCVIELSKPENLMWRFVMEDDSKLEHIILEVERLWPPFFGGRRVCTQTCEVGGYVIPKDCPVAYVSYSANRDKTVFTNADSFKPERWSLENSEDKDKVWTFGSGPRNCIGHLLSSGILKECLQELSRRFTWQLAPGQNLAYKVLPVSRPKDDISVVFSDKQP
ncbi:putative cytochrome P450 120 [Halichondria panicea]|uniref:putative cytochrome P450 120 n=1 Tax=Halichondria panicea TaxID=6063 RepID=UPI00312BCB68